MAENRFAQDCASAPEAPTNEPASPDHRAGGSDGDWWTAFPPPADFDGIEEGEPDGYGYKRTLSEAELAFIEAQEGENHAERLAEEVARRDLYFGFEGGCSEAEVFSPGT